MLGLLRGSSPAEQDALLRECVDMWSSTVRDAFGDEYVDLAEWPDHMWSVPEVQPILEMRGQLAQMQTRLMLGEPLTRGQVALLREWRHYLKLAKK